jgi:hypothetical protein
MPAYRYESEDGAWFEEFAHMSAAPPIGSVIVRDEVEYRRVPGRIGASVRRDTHFTSKSLPRNWPYAKRHNAQGQPQFGSKAEVSEAVERSQDTKMDAVEHDAL